jgi:hypothetical protein
MELFEEGRPGWCPHELKCVDMGDDGNLKSCCDLTVEALGHPTWTNCRVWGSCTLGGDAL